MGYGHSIPERKQRGQRKPGDATGGGLAGGLMHAWIQAEKMLQVAMMLPSAAFIGWVAGYGLDRWLHRTWMATAGVVFGIVSGLVGAVQMAIVFAADPKPSRRQPEEPIPVLPDNNGQDGQKPSDRGDAGTAR